MILVSCQGSGFRKIIPGPLYTTRQFWIRKIEIKPEKQSLILFVLFACWCVECLFYKCFWKNHKKNFQMVLIKSIRRWGVFKQNGIQNIFGHRTQWNFKHTFYKGKELMKIRWRYRNILDSDDEFCISSLLVFS